ncbi:MAG: DUF2017 family protein [Euzebya sp.]
MLFRRLVRHPEGGVRVTLPSNERALLLNMAATIRQVIADVDADTPPDDLTGRLFPRAYEDPLEEMEFADSMMAPLAEAKRTMLDTFTDSLSSGKVTDRRWKTNLDDEQTAAWLAVLQDGRQILSRVVGIQTEADWERLEDSDEEAAIVLGYLGDLQNSLIMLLMGGLPDPQ